MKNVPFKNVFLFQAPTEVEVAPISENTLIVNVTADEGTPEDAYFIAQVKANDGPSCQANASTESLECELTGLDDATKYTVGVRACIALTSRMEVCSQEVTTEGYTLPNRESMVHYVKNNSPIIPFIRYRFFYILRAAGTTTAVRIPQPFGGELYKTERREMGLRLQRDCS